MDNINDKRTKLRMLAQNLTIDNVRQTLDTLVNEYPLGYFSAVKSPKFKLLSDYILSSTSFLDDSFNFQTRLYYVRRNQTEILRCATCGKEYLKNISGKMPIDYRFHCNTFCAQRDKFIIDKIRNTKIENHTTTLDILESIQQTNIERYGCANFSKAQNFRTKGKRHALNDMV